MSDVPEDEEIGKIFVVNVNEDWIPLQGQLLINVWGDKICRVAYRENPWDTWGPPTEGEKR